MTQAVLGVPLKARAGKLFYRPITITTILRETIAMPATRERHSVKVIRQL